MDELLERFGSGSSASAPFPVNVYDKGEELLVIMEVPGVARDALQVDVRENVLAVAGTREAPAYKDASSLREECPSGRFSRTLRMPVKVDSERIEAHYRNGMLSIRLPKSEEARPKQIAIHA